jgi:hypothetical protein
MRRALESGKDEAFRGRLDAEGKFWMTAICQGSSRRLTKLWPDLVSKFFLIGRVCYILENPPFCGFIAEELLSDHS